MSKEIKIHSIKRCRSSLECALRKIKHYAAAGALRAHTHNFSQILPWKVEADERIRERMIAVYREEIDKNSANYFIVNHGWPNIIFDSHIVVAKHPSSPLYLALRSTNGERLICDYLSLLAIPESYVPTHNNEIDMTMFVLEKDYVITVKEGEGRLQGIDDNAFARLARGKRLTGEDYATSDKILRELEEKISEKSNLKSSLIKRFLRIFYF